jgi:hypothetical protein
MITVEAIVAEMKKNGFVVFEKDYDMNVVALRRLPGVPNTFDDLLCVFHMDQGKWVFNAWPCTTDPGAYHLRNPSRTAGTAILKHPCQNRGSHKIGFHHVGRPDQYEAMQQCAPVRVWRDADMDTELDYGENEQTADLNGINIHHAGQDSIAVEKWSAGCCVLKKTVDFTAFMLKMRQQKEAGHGDRVSLTVLGWPTEKF